MRNIYVKNIALSAMFTAISVTLCFFASIFPSMSLSVTAAAGLVSALSLHHSGYKYSMLVYIASSVLVLILVPDKEAAIFYVVLFGHYPMMKLFLERIGNKFLVWIIKMFAGLLLYAVVILISTYVLGVGEYIDAEGIVFTVALFVFALILYDICLSKIMKIYVIKVLQNSRFR